MFSVNGFRYFSSGETDVDRCPSFNRRTLETECYGPSRSGAEAKLACWNPKLKTMGVDNQPEHYTQCSIYAIINKRNDFVLGKHTATRIDLMDEQIRRNGLQRYEIFPSDYMRLADMTEGVEGAHILHYRGRPFTVIVKGSGEVNGRKFGVVRTIRRGLPSKCTTLPIIDHRDFAPPLPYASVMS